MKKLYIPTSTLNFNNIFACESISPASFYPIRNYGYKTFEKVKLNNFDNSILLYDKFPVFDIGDTERDNYPMIIEVDMLDENLKPIKTYQEVSIYQWTEPIYLNPFSVKVYFLSPATKKIALLGAERSLSTKMVGIYEKYSAFLLKDDSISSFQFNDNYLTEIRDVSNEDINKFIDIDQRKNRAKGFLYSYLLGANKSLNKELVTIKKCAREIGNIISAIVHSPDKSITNTQQNALSSLCNEFDNAYCRIDENSKKIIEKIKEIAEGNGLDSVNFEKALQQLNSLSDVKRNIAKQYGIKESLNIGELFKHIDSINLEDKNCTITEMVLGKEKKFLSEKEKIDISKKISMANLKLTDLKEDKSDFYTTLINEFLSFDYQKENRLAIAERGIKLLIKLFEENNREWKNSSQRSYYNELLANLQGKGGFDITQGEDNIIRQSFALFVLNKDDIDKIEMALITNLIPEYRFSFGLWGAVFGFASMPKTLTNDLFLLDDVNYISEVYKYIFKQIHNIDLFGSLERNGQQKTEEEKETATKQQAKANKTEVEYREKLNQIPKITEKQIDDVIKILIDNDFSIVKSLESISKIQGYSKKTKLFKNIEKCLKPENPQIEPQLSQNHSLFENEIAPIGKEFYKDKNVLSHIYPILSNDEEKKKIKKEIDWIQKVHKEGGYKKKSGEFVKLKEHSNKEVIEHFKNNCKNRIDNFILDKVIIKLKDLYLQNE